MSWFEIYVPFARLDSGLILLFAIWLAILGAGFVLPWIFRRRASDKP